MKSQADKAEEFRALHRAGPILLLPNCWDVPSARVFEEAGYSAVATSSAALMASLGYPDGESIPSGEYVTAVKRIAASLEVPLSVDLVGGFGEEPDAVVEAVRSMVEVGAVGINIEDFLHRSKALHLVEAQVAKIKAIKQFGVSSGVNLVVNARTDAYRFSAGTEAEKLAEAIRRAKAYRDAGADCVYPMGLKDANAIGTFVGELRFPTNVMVRPGLPNVKVLEQLGVKRLSFGPSPAYAAFGLLKRAAKEVLEVGTYTNLTEGAIGYDGLEELAGPKK